jgi:hypothetical protein
MTKARTAQSRSAECHSAVSQSVTLRDLKLPGASSRRCPAEFHWATQQVSNLRYAACASPNKNQTKLLQPFHNSRGGFAQNG